MSDTELKLATGPKNGNGHRVGEQMESRPSTRFDMAAPSLNWRERPTAPPADVLETAEAILVRIDLPGHKLEDVDVTVENDVLSIRSERAPVEGGRTYHRSELRYGVYARSFRLPVTVDSLRAEASFEAGVLTVRLPKRPEAQPRIVPVSQG